MGSTCSSSFGVLGGVQRLRQTVKVLLLGACPLTDYLLVYMWGGGEGYVCSVWVKMWDRALYRCKMQARKLGNKQKEICQPFICKPFMQLYTPAPFPIVFRLSPWSPANPKGANQGWVIRTSETFNTVKHALNTQYAYNTVLYFMHFESADFLPKMDPIHPKITQNVPNSFPIHFVLLIYYILALKAY